MSNFLSEYCDGKKVVYTKNEKEAQSVGFRPFNYVWRRGELRGTNAVYCATYADFLLLLSRWNLNNAGWHYGEFGIIPFSFFKGLVTSRPIGDYEKEKRRFDNLPFERPLEDTEQDRAYLRSQYRRFCRRENIPEMWCGYPTG